MCQTRVAVVCDISKQNFRVNHIKRTLQHYKRQLPTFQQYAVVYLSVCLIKDHYDNYINVAAWVRARVCMYGYVYAYTEFGIFKALVDEEYSLPTPLTCNGIIFSRRWTYLHNAKLLTYG